MTVAAEAFAKYHIQYYSLTDYTALLDLARERGAVSPDEQDILLKWRDDPANWKGVL